MNANVEIELRRLRRRANAALSIGLAGLAVGGAALWLAPKGGVIEARGFAVVNADGRLRALLGYEREGGPGGVATWGADGKPDVMIGDMAPQGAGVICYGGAGEQRAILGVDSLGEGLLVLKDAQDRWLVHINSNMNDEGPGLSVRDHSGQPSLNLGTNNGRAGFWLVDADNFIRGALSLGPAGPAALELGDRLARERCAQVLLAVDDAGVGGVWCADRTGRPVWSSVGQKSREP
jgi:hypothetical protein